MLTVKEIFPTIQREGSKAGSPAIFVRFAGCNLWSGQEHMRDKGRGECALWCDTDFFRGEKIHEADLLIKLQKMAHDFRHPMVVFTGGEPCLQLKKPEAVGLIERLLNTNWIVAVETNGTFGLDDCKALQILLEHPLGHITVSPKSLKKDMMSIDHLPLRTGTDLKVVCPTRLPLALLNAWEFDHFFFQPMDAQDGTNGLSNLHETIENAKLWGWRISCQTHKFLGVP